MTPFTWKNCRSDIGCWKHHITIVAYLNDVIIPALETLDMRIDELRRSEQPGDEFLQSDMEDVLRETKLAFGLSIQSIWERQIRNYLRGCAKELRLDETSANNVERANWRDLQKLFCRLRNIKLESFPSFVTLDTLQHLGNAGRHGDGTSAVELSRRCPDLWPSYQAMPAEPAQLNEGQLSVIAMDIPVKRLCDFVQAIAAFWLDVEYINNESIDQKHPSLEARLIRERNQRHWVPRAAADCS